MPTNIIGTEMGPITDILSLTIILDVSIDKVETQTIDAVFLLGGALVYVNLVINEKVMRIIQHMH